MKPVTTEDIEQALSPPYKQPSKEDTKKTVETLKLADAIRARKQKQVAKK